MSDKRQLRKNLKQTLSGIVQADKHLKSSVISNFLVELLASKFASNPDFILGVYAPLPSEVSWHLSFSKRQLGQVAYPKLPENEHNRMYFAHCLESELVESSEFGATIKVPPNDAKKVIPQALLIPGLGFTKDGKRLGRGGGFFDRYLEHYQGLKIGICFHEQLLDKLPTDPHDCQMDFVVTDHAMFESTKYKEKV